MSSDRKNKSVIIIAGPTAVGKTAAAIEAAKYFQTEIISADSRQCFKELKIGVARPSEEELKQVPHHFIASHSIHEEVNAVVFEQYALDKLSSIFKTKNIAVVTGGTGLYIKALCEGLDDVPAVSLQVRKKIIEHFKMHGLPWLQQQVKLNDPEFYEAGEIQNPQRLMRALEVVESTGKSIMHFRRGNIADRNFNVIKTGLALPKDQLHANINNRVDKMIAEGLVKETEALLPYKKLNALQTVGYMEIINYLEGNTTLKEAEELIKQHTRQYAKRQITWFKKDKEMQWFNPAEVKELIALIENKID